MNNKAPVSIWHNPRCSKSRDALKLLRNRGVEPEIVEYLKAPLTEEMVEAVLSKLGLEPRELMRKGEALYKQLRLKDEDDRDTLVYAMTHNPILIERPIILRGEVGVIGRPPENVLKLL